VNGRVIGTKVERLEDRPLLTGRARFVDDIAPPGLLEIAFVRSPHAHAEIRSIDKSEALALPGVHAVLTLADLRPHLTGTRLKTALPSPSYKLELHRPVLAEMDVVYVGEPVAVVVADTRYIAEDGAALVKVEYEPLPVAADARAGSAENAPRAHRAAPHNIAAEFTLEYGEVDAAFAVAAHIIRETFVQHRGCAHSLECRGVVATFDPIDGALTMWTSTQTPHAAKRILCDLLGCEDDKLRVVTPDVGGGFGPKLVFYPEEAVAAGCAVILRRAIKWVEDRREHFVATTQERDQYWDMEIAVDADGRVLGLRGAMLHDHGAYTTRGTTVAYSAAQSM